MPGAEAKSGTAAAYIMDVLVNCAEGQDPRQAPRLLPPTSPGVPLVIAFPLEQVRCEQSKLGIQASQSTV